MKELKHETQSAVNMMSCSCYFLFPVTHCASRTLSMVSILFIHKIKWPWKKSNNILHPFIISFWTKNRTALFIHDYDSNN